MHVEDCEETFWPSERQVIGSRLFRESGLAVVDVRGTRVERLCGFAFLHIVSNCQNCLFRRH
jgi:hypothetical protein